MKKNVRRMTKKKMLELKKRKSLTTSHVLIAVVALIECLLMIAFTTYSWIESSSSLVIMNGPQTTVTDEIANINITGELNYRVDLDTLGSIADINDYFRKVKYYEYSKTTSADGKTFFFPRRNNTNADSTEFRRGDTTDYNTSYYYFDFVIHNNTTSGKDFYFDPENCYTVDGNKTIFDIIGGDSKLSEEYDTTNHLTRIDALRSAMRMSISTQVGFGAAETKMYSVYGTSGYDSVNPSKLSATDSDIDTEVTTHNITDYVYATNGSAPTSTKLFTARKVNGDDSKDTKVSIRIWFDWLDPAFQDAFDFSASYNDFDSDLFKSIPSAQIGIKFGLVCYDNDFQAVYFDDYTFSNTANARHITDENSNYKMWFYAYQPATMRPGRSAGNVWLMMEEDSSSNTFNRWYTANATQSMMSTSSENVESGTGGMSDAHIEVAKFVYAPPNNDGNAPNQNASGVYTWMLPEKPGEDGYDFFNAYSYTAYSNANTKTGVGVWDDSSGNQMMLLRFNDAATATTDVNYNGSSNARKNFKFMNAKAEEDLDAHSGAASKNLLFVNNTNDNTTPAKNFTTAVAKTTAAMYYDADNEEFMSYVPRKWLVGDTKAVYINYCPDGYFSNASTNIRWYAGSPSASSVSNNDIVYNALGYTDAVNNLGWVFDYANGRQNVYFSGVGTWGDYEEIKISTELIDTTNLPAYRYFIGVQGYSKSDGWNYYSLIPNYDHTSFSAYVPKRTGEDAAGINFLRCSNYRDENQTTASVNAYWYGNRRYSYTTFYPVTVNATASVSNNDYTRGYWNVSVLVDGTYENLIYETLTDEDAIGKLEYAYTNNSNTVWTTIYDSSTSPVTDSNRIDCYRFYANAEVNSVVYWKWTPYPQRTATVGGNTVTYPVTEFIYVHDTTDGIYKLITEASNAVTDTGIPSGYPDNAEWPTEPGE